MRAILADACFQGARRLPRRQIVSSQRHGYPSACTLRSRRSTTARVRLACELLRAVVRDSPQVGADRGRGYGRGAGFGFRGGRVTRRDGTEGGAGGGGALCGGGGAGREGISGRVCEWRQETQSILIGPRLFAHCRFPRVSKSI